MDKLTLVFERFEVVLKSPMGEYYRFPLTVEETVDLAEHEIMREQVGRSICEDCAGTGCQLYENCGGIDKSCPNKDCVKLCHCT